MAQSGEIVFEFAGLIPDYCFVSYNRFALDIVAAMTGHLAGEYNTFNYGNSEPAVNDRSKPWLRTNPDGTMDRWYVFAGGLWVSPHEMEPGTRIISPSTLVSASDVWAWDGGDGTDPATTTPSYATGAMWEVDPILTARFPLGAGTLPSGAVVAPNATGGNETHALQPAEIPAHTHFVATSDNLANDDPVISTAQVARQKDLGGDSGNYKLIRSTLDATLGKTSNFGGDATGVTTPTNLMPPYGAVLFIRRTARTQRVP